MSELLADEFLNEYFLIKHKLDIESCYACLQNYFHSFKYHRCYFMTGDNKDQYNEIALYTLLARYNLVLKESELIKLNDWLNNSSRVCVKYLKDVYIQ